MAEISIGIDHRANPKEKYSARLERTEHNSFFSQPDLCRIKQPEVKMAGQIPHATIFRRIFISVLVLGQARNLRLLYHNLQSQSKKRFLPIDQIIEIVIRSFFLFCAEKSNEIEELVQPGE
jgi:hypothetical protein